VRRYWAMQLEYVDLLERALKVLERQNWALQNGALGFKSRSDMGEFNTLAQRIMDLSKALDVLTAELAKPLKDRRQPGAASVP
jgi:hypothetical protein